MFICTFYHTPVAFCDRGIVFYITKGVSLMRHPLSFISDYYTLLLFGRGSVGRGSFFRRSRIGLHILCQNDIQNDGYQK